HDEDGDYCTRTTSESRLYKIFEMDQDTSNNKKDTERSET
ncbi:43241_t:CDS:1, partial [Gigaspora margarita]